MSDLKIWAEDTPNPQSRKFLANTILAKEPLEITNAEEASVSPLANKLFGFPWMQSLYIGSNFVTITKQDWVEWDIITEPLCELIKEHIQNGEAIVLDVKSSDENTNDSEEVKVIKRILDREIRPQVALDGGDILFNKYENGIVHLFMKGACNGCPSSTQTLKLGVETRLKQALPEIKEVIAT